jgi:hypothetical protein
MSGAPRRWEDILIERAALTLVRTAETPVCTVRPERFWQNILRWRVEHIGRCANIRDAHDAVYARRFAA